MTTMTLFYDCIYKILNDIADEHYNFNNSFSPSHVIASSSITIINNIFTFINYYK